MSTLDGAKASWSIDESGAGLLMLPLGWTPSMYRVAAQEIKDMGYEVIPHDDWYVHMMGHSYYQLARVL